MCATDGSKQFIDNQSVRSGRLILDGTHGIQVQRGGAARSMPAYDDGSTPTLVTEKPPAVTYAVRMREGCSGGARGH